VLSGNRNFEGRINPDVKMNYLASPPLVVAYALAGTMDIDLTTEPLGTGTDGQPVYLADIWPTPQEIQEVVGQACVTEMFTDEYARCSTATSAGSAADPGGRHLRLGRGLDLHPQAPVLRRHGPNPSRSTDIPARGCWPSSATRSPPTTSPRPAPIKLDSPGGGVPDRARRRERRDFNSYGSRRGNHEVMIRGTFGNIRLRNQLAPGHRGRLTRDTCPTAR
jgi:aconitate hydratase